jgi:hypothetical protein
MCVALPVVGRFLLGSGFERAFLTRGNALSCVLLLVAYPAILEQRVSLGGFESIEFIAFTSVGIKYQLNNL